MVDARLANFDRVTDVLKAHTIDTSSLDQILRDIHDVRSCVFADHSVSLPIGRFPVNQ